MAVKINWDGLGVITSIACAIHCVVLPLLITSLPIFGYNIIENPVFEWTMIGIAFFVGAYSLFHGYRIHHRSLMPVLIFTAGFILLVSKQFDPNHEAIYLVPAVALIISAHYINFRLCRKKKCTSPHHAH